jgi:hypothetical protein
MPKDHSTFATSDTRCAISFDVVQVLALRALLCALAAALPPVRDPSDEGREKHFFLRS